MTSPNSLAQRIRAEAAAARPSRFTALMDIANEVAELELAVRIIRAEVERVKDK